MMCGYLWLVFLRLARRLHRIEAADVQNPQAPDYEGSSFYMGSAEERGGALVAPALSMHVAGKFRDEASVSKEIRKAKEGRPSAPAPAGPGAPAPAPKGKAKGKGKTPPAGPGAPVPP